MQNTTISFSTAAKKCIILVMIAVTAIFQLQAQTYSFTTCGAVGPTGPTQTQVNLTYAPTSITGVVSNNGIQEWTVPATGMYSLKVAGAKGGGAGGGNGAVLSGEFMLTQGQVIQIVVGQRGTGGFGQQGSVNSGGGGGGSFVVNKTTNTILLIAGGGGGGNGDYGPPYTNTAGNPASTGTSGNSTYLGGGGTNGNGGKNGVTNDPAAGGGGYFTNGENSGLASFATGGFAFVNGANGGSGRTGAYFGGHGGFGGGGGGVSNVLVRGGGGGGYSGGQGGSYSSAQPTVYTSFPDVGHGAGGGSINNGTNQLTYATNAAAGYVTFTALSTPAGALNFVKSNNTYITVPHSASMNLGAEFTIESWVNYTGVNSTIIDKGNYDYLLQVNCNNPGFAPNKLNFYNRNTGWVHSTGTVPEGVWTHVAVTLKNGIMTFYINGVASGTAAVTYAQDSGPVNIGRQSPSSCACNIFNGNMDELRVWNRALSACEINANKSCELSGTQTALAAYYKFNQGAVNMNNSAVNTLTDASGNNNTGTLLNFALTGTTSNWVAGQVSGTCAPYTAPAAAITGTLNACPGATSQLANSNAGGTWSSSNTTVASINASGLVTANAPGTSTITYTNSCGGVSTATFTVTALPLPIVTAGGPTTICAGGAVTLSTPQAVTGSSLSFNGINNSVRIPDVNYAGVNSFTIEAWVKPNNITSNPYYEIARQQGSPNWIFSFQDFGTILSFGLNTTTGYTELDAPITAASFTDGNWHHVAATYDGTNCRVYKDGVLIATNSKTGNIVFSSSGLTTYIGAYSGGEYFNGLIDEVRFWNTTRTQAQLDANKLISLPGNTAGLTAYYKFDEGTGTTTNDASANGNHGTLMNGTSWSAQTPMPSASALTYLWSPGGATTSSITANAAGSYTVTVTNANGCSATSEPTNVTVTAINNQPVAAAVSNLCGTGSSTITLASSQTGIYYTLRNNADNTIVAGPVAGTGAAINFNTGTIAATTTYNVLAETKPGGALTFNGSTFVTIPHSNNLNVSAGGQLTMEAWVNPAVSNQWRNILMKGAYGYGMAIDELNRLYFWDQGGGNAYNTWSDVTVPANTWSHVAITVQDMGSSLSVKLYLNGVNVGNKTSPIAQINDNTANLILGRQGTSCGCNFFNGKLDDVRIWNTVRSASDIAASMNSCLSGSETNLVALYKMDDGNGTTVLDSKAGNNGTVSGSTATWTTGNVSCGAICSQQMTETPTITVKPLPTVNPITNREVCHNAIPVTAIAFTGNISGTVYNWTNDNPSIGLAASGTGDIASFLGQNTGTVPVYATITVTPSYTSDDNTCTGTPVSFTIRVNPIPVIDPIANITVCNGTVTQPFNLSSAVAGSVFKWTQPTNIPYVNVGLPNGDGATVPSFTATNTGTTPITATYYAVSYYSGETMGCGTSRQFDVTVNPTPVATITASGPTTFCTGGSVTLTATGGASYLWSNGSTDASITVTSGGTYSVVATSAEGCASSSVSTTVTVNPVPTAAISASGSTTFCAGGSVTLTATGGASYLWSNGSTGASITVTSGGTYSVVATSAEGCASSSVSTTVTVNPLPTAAISASGSTTFCTGGTVTLTASTGASYLWSNGAQTQSITVNQSGNYSVVVTSAAGCTNSSSPVTVTVNALPATPVISTAGSTTVCVGSPVTLSAGGTSAGNAIDFDGSNDNIVIPNNAAFNFTSQYTVESWINLRSYQYGTIIAKFEDDNNNRGWMVNIGETGAPTLHVVHSRLGTWTNPIQWNSGFQPVLNTWYHIAVVFDAGLSSNQIKLYVNGALTAQTSWPYTITPNAANMYIGGYDNPGNGVNGGANGRFFNGRLDEVRVWNMARTAAQISANYNQVIAGPVTGLVAAYSFSETSGNTVQDATGVHNGTMVNNPTRISNGPLTSGGGNNTYLWSTGATSSSITVNQVGNYSVTVTNENGCAATSAPVTVSNYAMPTITCPGNITVAGAANQCGANVTYPNAVVTSGPANPTVTYSHPSGSFFPVGNTTVTATVTDACGNTASCTFVVTVQDTTPPVLACSNQTSSTPVNFMRGTSVGGTAAIVSWTGINGASQYASPALGSSCAESWRPFGTLCDETPNTNSMTTSTKSNPNSGITFNTGGVNSTGVFVVDLGATQTFNLAQVYQMFSDGKTTHVRGFYHPSASATAPSITDAGWVEMFPETLVGPGAISGNNVTMPTEITFAATSARYVRFYVRNDGRYGSGTWIETRSIKLFSTAPAVNNVVVTAADGQCNAVATYNVQAIDNCPGTVVTYSIPSGSSFPIGTTPVQVTATDASGNTTTCSFSVIVNAPEINITGNSNSIQTGTTATSAANNTNFGGTLPNTPVSKTFVIQNTGTAALKISSIGLSGTDASAFSVTGITLPATIAPNASANFNLVFNSNTPGIKDATVTINNNDCNEIAYQFAVTAEITCTNPVFVNLNPQVQANTTATTCNAVVNYPLSVNGIPAPALSYSFSGATTGSGSGTGTGNTFNKGNTHVIVTAVNPCSTVLYEFDVIVSDVTAPTAVAQNITVNLNAVGTVSITAAQVNNGSTDNCGIASIALDKTSFDCSNVGANTVTLTVTDVNGNVSTATAVVTVVDNTQPIVALQNITVNLNAGGTASITAAQVNNGSTDNCGIASIALDKTSFDCSNVGSNTVTLTVTDVNGNVSTATAVVTVVDNIAPSITAPAMVSVVNTPGSCMASVNLGTPVTSDNCGVATVTNNAPALFPVGTTIVRWTVTDIHGNVTDTATQEVVVIDNENPTISVTNTSVNNDAGKCAATVAISLPETADNCGVATVMGVRSDNKLLTEEYPVGTTTITWTVTDIHGNTKTAVQTVVVTDNEKPSITAPAMVSVVNIPGSCMASVNLGTPVTSDNCGVATVTNNAPALFPVGTTIVRWTVTDIHGNVTDTATQEVVVIDNENPTISVTHISVNNDAGKCAATVAISLPETADNCGVATVMGVRSDNKLLTEEYPVGTTTITWTVRDVNGNIKTAVQTVVVTDNEKPSITAPAMVSVVNIPGSCMASVNLGTPVTSDNCGVATVTNNAPALFPVGTTIVRWTVTDIHGNVTDTATQEVVVIDNENPTISVTHISVNNDAGKCAATVVISLPETADNCGVATVMGVRSDNKLLTEEYPVGTTTITWTVRDIHGNIKTATQTIVVTDNEKPVIVCAANQVFCANTGGNTQYSIPVLNQSDNCGIAGTTYSITGATNRTGTGTNASGSFAIGTSTVTFTVTDIHGNVSTCSFMVTINPLPVASISAASPNALCNQFTLTANSTLSGPFTYQWLYINNTRATTQQLSLGLTDADGVYSVYTTDVNGCRSELAASYNYQKQNLVSSYTILGMKEVKLGQYNKVETGSVGVMSSRGEAEFDKYSAVTGAGSFVKAPRIDTDKGVTINSKIYGVAGVTLPTMQYNTSNTRYLQDKTINSNVTTTVSGNYDEVTLKKGSNVTLTGTVFGKIKLEEGASVRFTSTTIDVEEIQIEKGPKSGGYSYIRFAPNTSIRVSKKVTIGSDVIVNPEAYQVTFFMADNRRDEEKFHVKGDDTRITANIILPDGKLKVTGGNYGDDRCDHKPHSSGSCRHRGHGHHDCDHRGHGDRDCRDDVFMTGLFIAEEVESEGKGIIWNSYNCAAPSAPVTALTSNNNKTSVTEEVAASGKLQAASKTEEELKVTVMPNPTRTYFTLKLESKYDAPVTLRVVDAAGRVVDSRAKVGSNSTIQIGHNYHAGNYFAELVQGNRRKTIQLIKVQ